MQAELLLNEEKKRHVSAAAYPDLKESVARDMIAGTWCRIHACLSYLRFSEMRARLDPTDEKGVEEEIVLDEFEEGTAHGIEGEEFEVDDAISIDEKSDWKKKLASVRFFPWPPYFREGSANLIHLS